MNITRTQLHAQCIGLRTEHPGHAAAFKAAVADSKHVDYALIRAIVSRETNMHNVVGDGGHGRGYFQIDDRSHGVWLRSVGAGSGTPPVSAAARYAVDLMEANILQAIAAGVPMGERLRVAVAGYNCGVGGALAAWGCGDIDARTAGGDYSADVLERAKTIRKARWA